MAKILVIRLSSLGDVVMLVPVIASVAAKYPQDRFSVMTRKAFAPLFQNLAFNINVIPLDLQKRHKGLLGFYRVCKRVLGLRFTHVADEHDVLRSKGIRFLLWWNRCKTAHISKGRNEKRHAIETKELNLPLKSTIQRYRDVFDKIGFPAEMTFTNFFAFSNRNMDELKPLVSEKKGKWIGIAPFSKHKGKNYPLEKMEKVIEVLSQDKDTTLFLLGGGKKEQKILDSWSKSYPNIVNTVGKLNFEKELLFISYLDVVLSMDSANMHLASLMQVPVVSIWGATHPSMGFYGFGQDIENALQGDIECRPCAVYGELDCERLDYACLHQISETRVVDKIHEVLAKQ